MSENINSNSLPDASFKRFLDTLERQLTVILDFLRPSEQTFTESNEQSIRVKLEKLVEKIGQYMHR